MDVTLPAHYKNKTFGICGNFNDDPEDDLQLSDGQIVNSDAEFGNHLKVWRKVELRFP